MLDTVLLAADGRPVPEAAADAELIRAVFSLIVAESTVFCLLKLLLVTAEWLWFVPGVRAGAPIVAIEWIKHENVGLLCFWPDWNRLGMHFDLIMEWFS